MIGIGKRVSNHQTIDFHCLARDGFREGQRRSPRSRFFASTVEESRPRHNFHIARYAAVRNKLADKLGYTFRFEERVQCNYSGPI